jgi:GGDEF domain-containing protein
MAGEASRAVARADLSEKGEIITASIGVASGPEEGSDVYEIFAVAERRVGEAKAAGGNCVMGRDGMLMGT